MSVQVRFHPGAARFLRVILFGLSLAVCVAALVRWKRHLAPATPPEGRGTPLQEALTPELIPSLPLCVSADAPEKVWSSALSAEINGQTEVLLENGRADVVSSEFAFEVDFIDRWHEGIGQAAHYGLALGKRPALAIVIPGPSDALTPDQLALLATVDRTCQEQRIKLLVLIRRCQSPAK